MGEGAGISFHTEGIARFPECSRTPHASCALNLGLIKSYQEAMAVETIFLFEIEVGQDV